jgi:hypothetical protein
VCIGTVPQLYGRRGLPYAYGQGLLRVRIRGVPVRIMKLCAYGDQHIYIIRVVVYGCNNPPVDEQERFGNTHNNTHNNTHDNQLYFWRHDILWTYCR